MNIFFASDHHLGHDNILTFTGLDGKLIRGEFSSIEEMHETIVERHNKVVGKNDKTYFGGDIGLKPQVLKEILPRMNGKKVLILGNHDKLRMDEYYKYFKSIYGAKNFSLHGIRMLLTHYPIHVDSEFPTHKFNIHGHIHEKTICQEGRIVNDKNYYNISLERINYTPVSLEDIAQYFKKQ